MNRATGQRMEPLEHLRQSIADILTTPIGSRVMRRGYGSLVPALVDQPDNVTTRMRLFAATASALQRWEPRLRLEKVTTTRLADQPGYAAIHITGAYVGSFGREPAPITLYIPFSGQSVGAAE